jgi:hypothetical protein
MSFGIDRKRKQTCSVYNWFDYGYCTFGSMHLRVAWSYIVLKEDKYER